MLKEHLPTEFLKNTISWYESFIAERHFTVEVINWVSKFAKTSYGVPQGSILSTLLLFVYDRTHRIGKPKNNAKPRPLIIKFVRYNDRKKVFSSKKLFKDLGVLIAFRMKKLTNARETFGFRNV